MLFGKRWNLLIGVSLIVAFVGCSQTFRLRDNSQSLRQIKRSLFEKKNPRAERNPCVEDVAREIDWLEHHIETYGTIVPKQPDVWGESRLTRYRHDVEKQLKNELDKFNATLQASVRRSDQSTLAMALAVDSVESGTPEANTNQAVTLIGDNGLLPKPDVSAPNSTSQSVDFKLNENGKNQISLEPTIYLDQMKRYLDHLNELRRINNGDDTADSPGYALHMVRIPISVLPGHRTKAGYGAEITITAKPILGLELLQSTFRDLIVNDIEDRMALPIANVVNQLTKEQLDFIERQLEDASNSAEIDSFYLPSSTENRTQDLRDQEQKIQGFAAGLKYRDVETWSLSEGGSSGRRARFAFPTSQINQVYGKSGINTVVKGAALLRRTQVSQAPFPNNVVHLVDVRGFLKPEISAAYDFLSQPENLHIWNQFCTPELARLVQTRNVEAVKQVRRQFYAMPGVQSEYEIKHWTTTSLAWAIIVESALLNEQLKKEISDLSLKKGLGINVADHVSFVGPEPTREAKEIFNEYVSNRWPIQVFALDPVSQDQNIADEFSRRRELQLAMAVSVARGTMRGSAASRFARRLETDIRTIALNKTHVAFSHGSDTFGWRFQPRVQSPPTPGTLQALTETFGGGPTPNQDIRDRQLEPGIRECTALIVMPSFVSYATFETRSNWFGLTNPRKKELTIHDSMKLSRSHQAIHTALPCISDCGLYRPVDVAQLSSVVEQLDRKMPLQNMTVQIPYENTMGGFEMFNSGVSDLGPQLDGWYGAPGVRLAECSGCDSCEAPALVVGDDPAAVAKAKTANDEICRCKGTTLFLVGSNFSVQDTRVIAGGKCVPEFTLLSRNVIQVTIPTGAHPIEYHDDLDQNRHKKFIDIHLSTPYGVSDHLLVPVYELHVHHVVTGAVTPASVVSPKNAHQD